MSTLKARVSHSEDGLVWYAIAGGIVYRSRNGGQTYRISSCLPELVRKHSIFVFNALVNIVD